MKGRIRGKIESPAIALVDGIRLDKTAGDLRNRSRLYIEFGCKELKLTDKVEKKALKILSMVNGPWGTRAGAAAAVYIAAYLSEEYRTQTDVSTIFSLGTRDRNNVSLRNNYAKIAGKLKISRAPFGIKNKKYWRLETEARQFV